AFAEQFSIADGDGKRIICRRADEDVRARKGELAEFQPLARPTLARHLRGEVYTNSFQHAVDDGITIRAVEVVVQLADETRDVINGIGYECAFPCEDIVEHVVPDGFWIASVEVEFGEVTVHSS